MQYIPQKYTWTEENSWSSQEEEGKDQNKTKNSHESSDGETFSYFTKF